MRAIVIDDSKVPRDILAECLEDLGFEVFKAGHGVEGKQVLEAVGRVDLILVDWIMPVMDGLEFIRAVRANRAHDKVNIMFVTVANEKQQVAEALAAGANEYLMKPVTKEMIAEKVKLLGISTAES